jgi:hypothetical protein
VKIYGFFNSNQEFGDAASVAIAETGEVVCSHWSSHEGWAIHDLGMDGTSNWKHDIYAAFAPEGYELEFVRIRDDRDNHAGLQAAFAANRELYPRDEEYPEESVQESDQ